MARDYTLNTVVPSPGTPIGYFTMKGETFEVLVTEQWRQQWFERVGTALFGPTGEEDVTAAIPTGSYVASVTVTANRGLSVTGTPGPGWTPNIVQSQDLRTSATVTFANVVCPGNVDGRDVSTDGSKLDTIATGATANSSDATLLARANHTGSQALATISDVTITASNLNILDNGTDTTLHFHDSDRARANHTGTQNWSTLTGTPTTISGYGITNAYTEGEVDTLVNAKVTKTVGISDASTAHALTAVFLDTEVEAALDALGAKINEIIDALNA